MGLDLPVQREPDDDQALTFRQQQELADLQKKQQDELIALLDSHGQEQKQVFSRTWQTATVGRTQAPPQSQIRNTVNQLPKAGFSNPLTPRPKTVLLQPDWSGVTRRAQLSTEVETIDLTSDNDDEPSPTKQTRAEELKARAQTLRTELGKRNSEALLPHLRGQCGHDCEYSKINTLDTGIPKLGPHQNTSTIGEVKSPRTASRVKVDSKLDNESYIKTSPRKPAVALALPRTPSRRKPLPPDVPTESPLCTLLQQMSDRSAILKELEKVARDPALLAVQQRKKEGYFVKDVLHNGRTQNWTSDLGGVFQSAYRNDTLTNKLLSREGKSLIIIFKYRSSEFKAAAHHVQQLPQQRALVQGITEDPFNISRSDNSSAGGGHSRAAARPGYLPTPCVTTAMSSGGRAASTFKVPAKPSSQFTSSASVLAELKQRRERELSTFTQQTMLSRQQKRKKVAALSSDDDSDFAPSEPSSPVLTKTKTASTTPKPITAQKNVGSKNQFGFETPRTPPAKAGSRGNSKPSTPARPAAKKTKFAPSTPEVSPSVRAASVKASKPGATRPNTSQPRIGMGLFAKRGARMKAEKKIRELAEGDAAFHMEEAMMAYDKEPPKPPNSMNEMNGRLRGMSLTPRPEARGALESDDGDEDGEKSVFDTEDWISERMSGDRFIAKCKAMDTSGGYEEVDQGDATSFKSINDDGGLSMNEV